MTSMRVLVTGSREWPQPNRVWEELDYVAWCTHASEIVVVHGACPDSPDITAREWVAARADEWSPYVYVVEDPYPANWKDLKKRAGFVRNEHMVNLGADLCLAFILNYSNGASHCADLAEERQIETRRFRL